MDNNIVLKRVLSVACAIFLIVYIAYQGYMMVYEPVKTETAFEYTIYDTVETEIFVVRDEQYISNHASGTIVPIVEDGKRVANGQEVAIVFENNQSASNYIKINEIEESINRYKMLQSQADNFTADLDTVDNEISSRLFSYLDTVSTGELDKIGHSSDALRDKIITRQIVTGTIIDFNSKINTLQEQLNRLNETNSDYNSITASHAGYYINQVDGYENITPYEKASALTVKEIENILKSKPNKIPPDSMGKLVNNFDWYMVCNVKSSSIGNMSVGDKIKVLLPFSSVSEVMAEVASLNDTNSEKTAVVLRCNLMDSNLANLRKENAELVFNQYTGMKLVSSAVRVNEKGEKGVFVLTGNIISFKKVEVLYSGKDFILVGNKNGEKGYIELYDNVVVEGTDLYDGKIIG
ncbi:MAG: HlyD family efflux transporter periplasmic adaptor subunit [Oscillospiraceae bacterium]